MPPDDAIPQAIPVAPAIQYAHDRAVTIDLPCRGCGQNLRGLAASDKCPRCGTSVQFSLDLQLPLADAPYRSRLHVAVNWIRGAELTFIVGAIAYILTPYMAPRLNTDADHFLQLLTGITHCLLIVGGWQLTASDPQGLIRTRHRALRLLIRVGVIAGFIAFLLHFDKSGPPYWLTWLTRLWARFIAFCLGYGSFIGILLFCRMIAIELGREKLVIHTRWLLRSYIVYFAVMAFLQLMAIVRNVIFIPALFHILRLFRTALAWGLYVDVILAVWFAIYLTQIHAALGSEPATEYSPSASLGNREPD